ncbi:MAG: hypothetical protein L0312_19605 [Acidobacteria bacterium]|nr:hypothetical protein [Acidobacteriota bacterium]
MNKKLLISVVVIFVVSMGLGFLVHGVLLAPEYAQLPNLFRTPQDAERYFFYMLLAHVLISFGFVWIYLRGRENKPFLAQGVRYGVAIAVLMTIPMYLIYYAVQPMPAPLVCKQIIFDTLGVILMGIVVAWLNK